MTSLVFKSLLVIIVLYGASVFIWDYSAQTKIKKLQGHWHSNTEGHITLDVMDTLVIVNRYSRISVPDTFSIIDRELGRVVLPLHCGCGGSLFPEMSRFTIQGDVLTYDSITSHWCYAFKDMRFMRCDPTACQLGHALEPYAGPINFDQLPLAREVSTMQLNSPLHGILLIGFPSEEYGVGPRIQVNDVLISPEHLHQYFNLEKENAAGLKRNFVWVIDAAVPADFLANVFQHVPRDSSSHYQLVVSDDKGEIGYQLVDPL